MFLSLFSWPSLRLGAALRLGLRELTDWLVRRHTRLGSIDDYFDGYSIAGDRLRALQVPAHVLMAADDPVIPVDDFHRLQLPANAALRLERWGGPCGFLENARLWHRSMRLNLDSIGVKPKPLGGLS